MYLDDFLLFLFLKVCTDVAVVLYSTQIISRQQKNADAKVALSI